MDASRWMEQALRKKRFKEATQYIIEGKVLDFGCDNKELKSYLSPLNEYIGIDKKDSIPKETDFDYVVMLAVIEHLEVSDMVPLMLKLKARLKKHGELILTTPTPLAKKPLDIMASLNLLEKKGIEEHKYYYNERDLRILAETLHTDVLIYYTFEFNMNQLMILRKR